MKKGLLFFILCLIVSGLGFSLGVADITFDEGLVDTTQFSELVSEVRYAVRTEVDENGHIDFDNPVYDIFLQLGNKKAQVNTSYHTGITKFTITNQLEEDEAVFIIQRQGDTYYLLTSEGEIALDFDFTDLEHQIQFEFSDHEVGSVKINRYAMGLSAITDPTRYAQLINSLSRKNETSITIQHFGQMRFDYVILFKAADDQLYFEFLSFDVFHEFFKGEEELVDTVSNWTYTGYDDTNDPFKMKLYAAKAAELVRNHFNLSLSSNDPVYEGSGEWREIRVHPAIKDIEVTVTDESLIHVSSEEDSPFIRDTVYGPALRDMVSRNILIRSEEREYEGETITLPYLDYTARSFEMIYGESNFDTPEVLDNKRNVYLMPYLRNLLHMEKPLLSNLFRKSLARLNDKVLYHYDNYKALTPAEGEALAGAALKYLTWGVEYTPYIKNETYIANYYFNEVFGSNLDKIESWIDLDNKADLSNRKRALNYLPDAGSEDELVFTVPTDDVDNNSYVPSPVHIFENDFGTVNNLYFYAHKDSEKTVDINNISFWSAWNLLWKGAGTVYKQDVFNNRVELANINDKNRFTADSVTQGSTIAAAFNKPERIGGILAIGDNLESINEISAVIDGREEQIYEYSTADEIEILGLLREAYGKPASENIENYPVKSSGSEESSNYPLHFAYDGDPDTFWSSKKSNFQSFEMDLGEVRDLQTIIVDFKRAAGGGIEGVVGGGRFAVMVKEKSSDSYLNLGATFDAYFYSKRGTEYVSLFPDEMDSIGVEVDDQLWIRLQSKKKIRYIKIVDITPPGTGGADAAGFSIKEFQLYKGNFANENAVRNSKFLFDEDAVEIIQSLGDKVSCTSNSDFGDNRKAINVIDGDERSSWRSKMYENEPAVNKMTLSLDLGEVKTVQTIRLHINIGYSDFQIKVKGAAGSLDTTICDSTIAKFYSYSGGYHTSQKIDYLMRGRAANQVGTELQVNPETGTLNINSNWVDLWIVLEQPMDIQYLTIEDHNKELGLLKAGTDYTAEVTRNVSIYEISMYKKAFTGYNKIPAAQRPKKYYDTVVLDSDKGEFVTTDDLMANKPVSRNHYYVLRRPLEGVDEVKIQMKSSSSAVDIGELLVFDDDPLKYVTGKNKYRSRFNVYTDLIEARINSVNSEEDSILLDDNSEAIKNGRSYLKRLIAPNLVINQDDETFIKYVASMPDSNFDNSIRINPSYNSHTVVNDSYAYNRTDDSIEIWEQSDNNRSAFLADNYQWAWIRSSYNREGFAPVTNAYLTNFLLDENNVKDLGITYKGFTTKEIKDVKGINTIEYHEEKSDIFFLKLSFVNSISVKTVAVWENSAGSTLRDELRITDDIDDKFMEYFMNTKPLSSFASSFAFSTPFKKTVEGKTVQVLGNPLPYAPMGIDSPRTFAYKMWEQWKARKWAVAFAANELQNNSPDIALHDYYELLTDDYKMGYSTSKAIDASRFESFQNSYISEMDVALLEDDKRLTIDSGSYVYNEEYPFVQDQPVYPMVNGYNKGAYGTVKPFLPNLQLTNRDGYVHEVEGAAVHSLYNPDKVAGVDSAGLLSGAISMAGFDVLDAFNRNISLNTNGYFQMKKGSSDNPTPKGLDEYGKPVYYAQEGNSFLDGVYRLSRSDIEKTSVLVPDISYIQVGDLLVRYDEEGEPHIGIVVKLDWKADENGENHPQYGDDAAEWWDQVHVVSVRKGLQSVHLGTWGTNGNTFNVFTAESKAYQIRRLLKADVDDVKSETQVKDREPWELVDTFTKKLRDHYPPRAQVPSIYNPVGIINLNSFKRAIENENKFYRELPASSFQHKAQVPIINAPIIFVNNLTGFREWGYHRGVDLALGLQLDAANRKAIMDTGFCDDEQAHILAPEDGLFYVFKPKDYDNGNSQRNKISLPDELLELGRFSEQYFGFLGVLITNPVNPKTGRVYVIAHMGPKSGSFVNGRWVNTGDDKSEPQLRYANTYIEEYGKYPDSIENAVTVSAGDWIGWVGSRGRSSGPHIHLEIWEYFARSPNMGDSNGWERVEPLSCFDEGLLIKLNSSDSVYNWWRSVFGAHTDVNPLAVENNSRPFTINPWGTENGISSWVDVLYYNDLDDHFNKPELERQNWLKKFYIIDSNF